MKRGSSKKHGGSAKIQDALYRIAELASSASDMREFYAQIHDIVGKLMYAHNFFIALYDADTKLLNYPYYADAVDPDMPDPDTWQPMGTGASSRYDCLRVTCRTKHSTSRQKRLNTLIAAGRDRARSARIGSDWVGVPLKVDGQPIGAMVSRPMSPARATRQGRRAAQLRRPACRVGAQSRSRDRGDEAPARGNQPARR